MEVRINGGLPPCRIGLKGLATKHKKQDRSTIISHYPLQKFHPTFTLFSPVNLPGGPCPATNTPGCGLKLGPSPKISLGTPQLLGLVLGGPLPNGDR